MRTGRPKQPLTLTAEERERLESLAHRARTLPLLARRARIVLACADGLDNKTVARRLRASLGMVGKWRARFLQARLEGLYDEPRPGAPRTVSDAQVEHVVVQTLESTPRRATHWSTRGLAQATGLSRMTISRIWPAFGPSSSASSWTRSKPRCRPTSMSTSSWTTMGPTRRPSSGGGLRNVHASMSTTRPPTGPGSTWSSGGLPNSPTSKSAAGFTAVSANWRPPSANSSPPTTKPPSLSFGPKPPTKSSLASLATRNALSPPNPGNLSHEPLGQETRRRPKTRFSRSRCCLTSDFPPTRYPLFRWEGLPS